MQKPNTNGRIGHQHNSFSRGYIYQGESQYRTQRFQPTSSPISRGGFSEDEWDQGEPDLDASVETELPSDSKHVPVQDGEESAVELSDEPEMKANKKRNKIPLSTYSQMTSGASSSLASKKNNRILLSDLDEPDTPESTTKFPPKIQNNNPTDLNITNFQEEMNQYNKMMEALRKEYERDLEEVKGHLAEVQEKLQEREELLQFSEQLNHKYEGELKEVYNEYEIKDEELKKAQKLLTRLVREIQDQKTKISALEKQLATKERFLQEEEVEEEEEIYTIPKKTEKNSIRREDSSLEPNDPFSNSYRNIYAREMKEKESPTEHWKEEPKYPSPQTEESKYHSSKSQTFQETKDQSPDSSFQPSNPKYQYSNSYPSPEAENRISEPKYQQTKDKESNKNSGTRDVKEDLGTNSSNNSSKDSLNSSLNSPNRSNEFNYARFKKVHGTLNRFEVAPSILETRKIERDLNLPYGTDRITLQLKDTLELEKELIACYRERNQKESEWQHLQSHRIKTREAMEQRERVETDLDRLSKQISHLKRQIKLKSVL